MYRVAYMYVPPPPAPKDPVLPCTPLGVNELTIPETHRRQPAEGRRESTDQVTALKASDQYIEGTLLSTQVVYIVTYCYQVRNVTTHIVTCYHHIKYASYLHSYLCMRLLMSSCQVRNLITLLSSYQVHKWYALLSSYQVCKLFA